MTGTPDQPATLRVLMFSYFYPPMGGAGVQRSLKFSKYFPDFGVAPSVICADDPEYPHDASLVPQIPPSIRVIRITHTPMLSRFVARRRHRKNDVQSPRRGSPVPRRVTGVWRDRLLSAWASIQFPDDKAGWARRARRAARDLISASPVDVILSSSPPISAHLAAMRLARETGLPWVADVRDLWSGNPANPTPRWRRTIDRMWERRLLSRAAGIVTVTESFSAELRALGSGRVPVELIRNGYDEEDFRRRSPAPRDPRTFRVVHSGTFYGLRSPEPFLAGVRQWLEQHQSEGDGIQVRLVGSVGTRFAEVIEAFERDFPGVVQALGYVGHDEALAEILAADALLLVVGSTDSTAVPAKLYEYLRAGRPILFVGPTESEAARLILSCNAGTVVDEHDSNKIAVVLERWMRGDTPRPDPALATQFDRRWLTGRLAAFLREIALSRVAPSPGPSHQDTRS